MPDYSHLSTPAAASRYAMAAYYLSGCTNVVEVGGCNLHTFMSSPDTVFWNIDPTAETLETEWIKTVGVGAKDFDFNWIPRRVKNHERNGIALLGLEMYDGEFGVGSGVESAEAVGNALVNFDVAVIEFVLTNDVSRMQALMLKGAACFGADMEIRVHIETKWCPLMGVEHNDSYSKPRQFWVLTR